MWALLEILVFLFVITTLVTQIVMPAIRNTPMFPILHREKKLAEKLAETKQDVVENKLEKEIQKEKDKLKK